MRDRLVVLQDTIQQKNLLHDFYGELLTPKQSACYTMHYMEDLSLSEIAEQCNVTPQAVADQIKKTTALLQKYETRLGLLKKHHALCEYQHQMEESVLKLAHAWRDGESSTVMDQIVRLRKMVKDMPV